MNQAELLYLLPYLVSLVVFGAIFGYTLRNHYIRGAPAFAWLIGGQMLTTIGALLELFSPSLETRLLWDSIQSLSTGFLVVLPFLFFTVQLTKHATRFASILFAVVLTLLGIFAALILTNDIHHLFYQNARLTTHGPFRELTYDVSFASFAFLFLCVYGANFYGIGLLIRRAFEPQYAFRMQFLIIALGFLIPLIFSFLALAGIQSRPEQNAAPLASALGGLVAAWGLFRYGVFDIARLARAQTIESLEDLIVVLDPRNRIVDINQAALAFLEKPKPNVVGRIFEVAFARWPELTNIIRNPFVQKKEILTTMDDRILFLDVDVSPIVDRKREVIGRIIVIRDQTKLKTLEASYEKLANELEQRVQKRTEELQTIAERYRAIVENQTDLIVRWKPDGTRTFVNEAYCRYWGVSYEQALAMNFLFHTPAEDRPDIEEKINRLNSGASDFETEVHRVTRPDGSLAWQEWTDKAIRDEWGKLIEIQSTGRDITERKKAEQDLAQGS
jgi:PAS domain S-box-containing protein